MSPLEHDFHAAMWGIYQEAKKLGYHASYFARMLDEMGGLATAKKLINAPSVFEGFERLWSLRRLDLTVEAVALQPAILHAPYDGGTRNLSRRLADLGYRQTSSAQS